MQSDEEVLVPASSEVTSAIEMLTNPAAFARTLYFSKPAPVAPSKDASAAEHEAYQEARLAYAADVLHMQGKADHKAATATNERINLVHVLAHSATVRNEDTETGEVRYVPVDRVVLMDDEGRTYECVSGGLMQSLLILFQLLGSPDTWRKPVPIKIVSVDVRNKWRTLKIEIWQEKSAKK